MHVWHIVAGSNTEDLFVEMEESCVLAGGIKHSNKVDDGKRKEVRLLDKSENIEITMKKGRGHSWTKFCEDSIVVVSDVDNNKLVTAVFDGVSGPTDGSGGIASRQAADILKAMLSQTVPGLESCDYFMESFKNKCIDKISVGATTALVLFAQGSKAKLYNKGDSVCFCGEDLMNSTHSVMGSMLTTWLNTQDEFEVVPFDIKDKQVELCSDGIYNESFDDFTVISIKAI